MARQHQVTPVGGRQMDIDHLHGRELLQDRPRRQPRRSRSGQVLQGDVQAVGDEGDEDVRLDPRLCAMEDRADGQIVLQFLERLLDLGELHVVAPQRGRILAGQVGAQQIAALAPPCLAQPLAPQRERERLWRDRFASLGQTDLDQVPGASGLLLRRAQLQQQFVALQRLPAQLVQSPP